MTIEKIEWKFACFEELTLQELYKILQARQDVFVVEQNCPYLDIDDYDEIAYQLMGLQNDKLVASARILPPGSKFKQPSIGRVLIAREVRGTGLGRRLFESALMHVQQLYSGQGTAIQAQLYLEKFYGSYGFKRISEIYDWDGIDHVDMLKEF